MESAVFLDPKIEKLPCSPFQFDLWRVASNEASRSLVGGWV